MSRLSSELLVFCLLTVSRSLAPAAARRGLSFQLTLFLRSVIPSGVTMFGIDCNGTSKLTREPTRLMNHQTHNRTKLVLHGDSNSSSPRRRRPGSAVQEERASSDSGAVLESAVWEALKLVQEVLLLEDAFALATQARAPGAALPTLHQTLMEDPRSLFSILEFVRYPVREERSRIRFRHSSSVPFGQAQRDDCRRLVCGP